jgi:hypothetical protein
LCTLVVLRRPGHDWPLLLAANRDELESRAWQAPGRHWPDRPEVIGGRDALSGGSWMALNDHGVVACVLNRRGTLGPAPGKRSRGELVLEALDHADASEAALALADLDPRAYRAFNLVIADNHTAFWLRLSHEGAEAVEVTPLPQGLSMITAYDRNDPQSARVRRYLPRFEAAAVPDPDRGDWAAWQALVAAREADADGFWGSAMTVARDDGFATVSSSLLALPAPAASLSEPPRPPVWLFAPGRPDRTAFQAVDLAN